MIDLKLPFKGEWFVIWGGDTEELNKHHDNPAQKYAFDFVIFNKIHKTFQSDGEINEDYFCFEKEILSPADGKIVQVVDGIEDNEPGYLNGYWVAGNTVVISHSDNLFSFLAHFKKNSINVLVGQEVKVGDFLGLCGNSGNSSEPHLHFHLQDSANILFAKGLKCSFSEIRVFKNKEMVILKNYSPVRGDIISNVD